MGEIEFSNYETWSLVDLGSAHASRALRGASPRSGNIVDEESATAFGEKLAGAMGVAGRGAGNSTRGVCAFQVRS